MRAILIYLFLAVFSFIRSQTLSTSLTACYSFDGNTNDAVNGLNSTFAAATPTVDRFNTANSAYAFSGSTTSYIELPDDPLLKPTNAITFAGWVKPGSLASNQYIVFTKNPTISNFEAYCLAIANSGGLSRFKAHKGDGSGSTNDATSTTTLSIGTWYHVAVSIDNSMINIYVNGTLETSAPTTYLFSYQAGKKIILGGSNEASFNLPFTGSIDNLRFYNRMLTANEVSQLYTLDPGCVVPSAFFSVSPPTLCVGSPVNLTDLSSNNPTSWNWQFPGANPSSSSLNNPTVSFSTPGSHVISLIALNNSGSSAPVTQTVQVYANPSVNALSSVNVTCAGETATMVATGAFSYFWSSGSTTQQEVVSPTINTTYTVTGTNTFGCMNSTTVSIGVIAKPVLTVASSNTLICGGQTATLSVTGAITYNWNNGLSAPTITINPLATSIYTVTGINGNGCANSATIAQLVLAKPSVTLTSSSAVLCVGKSVTIIANGGSSYVWSNGQTSSQIAVSPTITTSYNVTATGSNGCTSVESITQVVDPCVGIEESTGDSSIRIYPNPSSDNLEIISGESESLRYMIINMVGDIIQIGQLNNKRRSLDISTYSNGVYFLRVENKKTEQTFKFIKH